MRILSLLIVLTLLLVTVNAQEYQSITNESMGYTVQCPTDWKVMPVASRANVAAEVIIDQMMCWGPAGGYITIDAWNNEVPGDILVWLRVMEGNLGLEASLLQSRKATIDNLDAVAYDFVSAKQAFHSKMVFFKRQGKVFRISYLQRDGGNGLPVFEHMVATFAFTTTGKKLSEVRSTMEKEVSRIYSCGGHNDSCQCNMSNPYPCCDNNSNCTWWAWHKACCVWGIGLPSPWRNAKCWAGDLRSNGYSVSSTPAVNTIACRDIGTYGHVAWVIAVSGSQVKVSEMNCCPGCHSGSREHWYEASYFTGGYIYRP